MAVSRFTDPVAEIFGSNTQVVSGSVDAGSDSDRVLVVLVVSGAGGAGHSHPNAPTYNGVAMTQIGTQHDLRNGNSTAGNRMTSAYYLEDPASGVNTLSMDMGQSLTQTTLIPIVLHGADSVGKTSHAFDSTGSDGNPTITDTPNNSDSHLLGLVAGDAGNIDPYTAQNGTEIWDSGDSGSSSNTSSWVGEKTGVSGSQTISATQSSTGEWGIWFVEVTAAATSEPIDLTHAALGATFNTMTVAEASIDLAHADLSATFNNIEVLGGTELSPLDASATFHTMTVEASLGGVCDLDHADLSATFNNPDVVAIIGLDNADVSATFHQPQIDGAIVLEHLHNTQFHNLTVTGFAINLELMDGSAVFHDLSVVGTVTLAHISGTTFHQPVVADASIDLDHLDASARFPTMQIGDQDEANKWSLRGVS